MAKRTVQDIFTNRAFETVTMSGNDTLTFSQVQFGVGLFQGVAAIIHRIEWFLPDAVVRYMSAQTDSCQLALTNRDDLAALTPSSQNVLAYRALTGNAFGTAASGMIVDMPVVHSFADLGGGGLIVPVNPLYIAMDSDGFAGVGIAQAIIYLTFKTLTDPEYVELIQTIMPANL